uniref:Uncharacterized protein n=1 Tax=Triticum urartu TaxID=4572 RepID=A0A8R7TBE5_TRIUA
FIYGGDKQATQRNNERILPSSIYLVKQVERSWITSLDSEDHPAIRHHCLLPSRQLFHGPSFSLASEGNLDFHTNIDLYPPFRIWFVRWVVIHVTITSIT